MAITVKKNTSYAVELEVTEGTYVPPSAASSYVQTLTDGAELTQSKELLERNVNTSSIGKTTPRVGQTQAAGSLPVEARASSTEGGAPEFDKLMKSAMGSSRNASTTTTTKASGNTATVLQIDDADISKFNIGDSIMVKQSGAYHVSPITAKTTGTGTATITMLVPHPSGDCTDSVVISKFTTYIVADSGHPSLSISKYVEGTIREYATGCKVTSMSLENFSTGQLPSFNFSFEGLNYNSSVSSIPHTPSYDSSLPPIILSAGAYMDGAAVTINSLSFSLENSLAFQTDISASNGRTASRATERSITGSFDPFKQDNSVANYTKYQANTAFSLFGYAMVPTATPGQFGQVIAFYMPNCIITELGESDLDGLLQDAITFQASRGASGTTSELYLSFI
jgi:hypothetical protein